MKRVLSSGAGLLLIALAFLAFNMVSGLLFSGARLDLTEQKLYTISPGTKRILAGLDEPINLYFFYSDSGARELVPLRNYARRVEELLRAYEREANGRIRLQVIDPEPFSENEDKATEFGLQGIPRSRAATTCTSVWPAATPWTESRSYPSSRSIRRSSSNTTSAAWCRPWPSRSGRWSA